MDTTQIILDVFKKVYSETEVELSKIVFFRKKDSKDPFLNVTQKDGTTENNLAIDTLAQRMYLNNMVFNKLEKGVKKLKKDYLLCGFDIEVTEAEIKYFYINTLKQKIYFTF